MTAFVVKSAVKRAILTAICRPLSHSSRALLTALCGCRRCGAGDVSVTDVG